MDKQKAIDAAVKLFPNYPSVNTFYVTSDEQVFEDDKQAADHAATLKDATVHDIHRNEIVNIED